MLEKARATFAAMDDSFPKNVKDFIHQHIHSLAQLEVLLKLHREPDRDWTVEEVTSSLYLQPKMVSGLLADLVQRGFVAEQGGAFCYGPKTDDARDIIGRLAALYKERRVAVTTEIFAKPIDSARAFADAFRLRRKE